MLSALVGADRGRGTGGSRSPLPSCPPSRQPKTEVRKVLTSTLAFPCKPARHGEGTFANQRHLGSKTLLVMRPQLCPPYPGGTGEILHLRQKPPISILSARLNYDFKSALMNYSEGFGVKFMLEKYMFQIS